MDDHVLEYKLELVRALLIGRLVAGAKGLPKTEFLSQRTKPTENAAREALINLLFQIKGELSDMRLRSTISLVALAFFEEAFFHPVKVVLKRRSKGHSDRRRDYYIAKLVQQLRNEGEPYDQAAARVANDLNLNERHIKRIYARHKDRLAVSSDGRSGDMASDR